MKDITSTPYAPPDERENTSDTAMALALRLAHAENALLALTAGQVDAVVDPSGRTYLLRPAQEYLRENEKRLRAILDGAADVLLVLNRGGEVLSQSRAAGRMLGYEPKELVGKNLMDLVHPDDLPDFHSKFFNVIEDLRADATVEFRHKTGDGEYRTLEATVGKLHDFPGANVVLVCRDATRHAKARAEGELREAIFARAAMVKDRFLAMLSHELRTPLTPAVLGLHALLEDERFAEAKPELTMILRNIELQGRLLDELMDFTKVGEHKVRLRLSLVDVNESVRLVLEICESEIAAAHIEVLLDLRALERYVVADGARIQQVLWNLVKNAVKFSTPGSTILITSANDETGGLVIEVIDHGIGIDPELLSLVFDAFQQGDQSILHRHGGLGLGMFIAKGLAEAQEGTLAVSSGGLGKGTTFSLRFGTARNEKGDAQSGE